MISQQNDSIPHNNMHLAKRTSLWQNLLYQGRYISRHFLRTNSVVHQTIQSKSIKH